MTNSDKIFYEETLRQLRGMDRCARILNRAMIGIALVWLVLIGTILVTR